MVRIVISTMGYWEKWTYPLLNSLYKNEKVYSTVVVDGSAKQVTHLFPHNTNIIVHEWPGCSLSQAINWGAIHPDDNWDWLLWLADDNLVTASFIDKLDILDPLTVWHRKIVTNDKLVWGDGGQMLISKQLWNKVGQLDETLQMGCEFMDLDYTMRAQKYHGHVGRLYLPIKNLDGNVRNTEKGLLAREYNRKVMSRKWNTDLTKMHG